MSSLRPLATITLLAAVGVFLYMKINETEPALPPGVSEWSPDALEIGDGGDTLAASPAAQPPTVTIDSPAVAASSAPTTAAEAPSDGAPPWTPGPLAITEPAAEAAPPAAAPAEKSTDESSSDSSAIARTAEPPATPEMPPLPSPTTTSPAPTSPASTASTSTPTAPAAAPSTAEEAAAAAAVAAAPAAAAIANAATQDSTTRDAVTPTADATTPTPTPRANAAAPSSMFAAARVAVQGALDRGELAQALLLLSDWYDDPSLTPEESKEVEGLLSQLAGSVIYEGPPAHRLEKAYIVQAGETLETIAAKYDVPWQLLAKINGIAQPNALEPGQELKVVRGPFSALVDMSERRMTLMLDRRYAGQFAVELDPTSSIEEGQWKVDQKLLTPASAGLYGPSTQGSEDRSLLLASLTNPSGSPAVVRGPGAADPVTAEPKGRVIRLKGTDVNDVYDILSEGSRVTIRR